jgi:hypothetical protein
VNKKWPPAADFAATATDRWFLNCVTSADMGLDLKSPLLALFAASDKQL